MPFAAEHQIIVEDDIHIERAARVALAAADAAVAVFQRMQPVAERLGGQVAFETDGGCEESGGTEAPRRAAIHGRYDERAEASAQFLHRRRKPAPGIDVG